MKICVTCERCGGTGKIDSHALTETAKALSTRVPMTASEVHAKLGGDTSGVKVNAVNNRLAQLVEIGVATVAQKNGKVKLYLRVRTSRGNQQPTNTLQP